MDKACMYKNVACQVFCVSVYGGDGGGEGCGDFHCTLLKSHE